MDAVDPADAGRRHQVRVRVRVGDDTVASGRCVLDGDWVGVLGLSVDPAHRRHGLARSVLAGLLEAAAERGATTAWLQVVADNAPARTLYDALGWAPHHAYRYLAPRPTSVTGGR